MLASQRLVNTRASGVCSSFTGSNAALKTHRCRPFVRQTVVTFAKAVADEGTASTLTRTEVRGGGKKPYKQKGTGNARRGSSVSPLFPGGGISFGPKPKDWSISMNKKERRLALATALRSAARDIVVVDSLQDFQEPKTKALLGVFEKLGVDIVNRKALLITKDINRPVLLAGRNISKLFMNSASSIRVFDVLNAERIVIERAALDEINKLYGATSDE